MTGVSITAASGQMLSLTATVESRKSMPLRDMLIVFRSSPDRCRVYPTSLSAVDNSNSDTRLAAHNDLALALARCNRLRSNRGMARKRCLQWPSLIVVESLLAVESLGHLEVGSSGEEARNLVVHQGSQQAGSQEEDHRRDQGSQLVALESRDQEIQDLQLLLPVLAVQLLFLLVD